MKYFILFIISLFTFIPIKSKNITDSLYVPRYESTFFTSSKSQAFFVTHADVLQETGRQDSNLY